MAFCLKCSVEIIHKPQSVINELEKGNKLEKVKSIRENKNELDTKKAEKHQL